MVSFLRGPSAILVHLPCKAFIMLDCGEGTYGALLRYYGSTGAKAIVSLLSSIIIESLFYCSNHKRSPIKAVEMSD